MVTGQESSVNLQMNLHTCTWKLAPFQKRSYKSLVFEGEGNTSVHFVEFWVFPSEKKICLKYMKQQAPGVQWSDIRWQLSWSTVLHNKFGLSSGVWSSGARLTPAYSIANTQTHLSKKRVESSKGCWLLTPFHYWQNLILFANISEHLLCSK